MIASIVVLLFSVLLVVFATQNTGVTNVTVANYTLTDVPIYLIALGGLLVGVLISWILSLFDSVAAFFAIHGKNTQLSSQNKTISDIRRKVRELELENAKLRGQRDATRPGLDILTKPRTIS